MNIGKSVNVAMAMQQMSSATLTEKLGIDRSTLYQIKKKKEVGGARLRQLAEIFGMSVSEFVKLGE